MTAPTHVLVLGGSGMLGSAVVSELARQGFRVSAAARRLLPMPPGVRALVAGDLTAAEEAARTFGAASPDVVVNCVGLVKQRETATEPIAAISINALLPHKLAALCKQSGARLIHISTDCVFSGAPQGQRGPLGYREADFADAADLYGRSKLLGEATGPGCLTLRMSLIGREPSGSSSGLVEWFLSASPPLHGFAGALFTGVTTAVAASLIARILREQPALEGLWHAAAEPISKLDLLRAMADRARPGLVVEPVAEPIIDRRLDGSALASRLQWSAPPWPDMLDEMFSVPAT